MGVMSDDQFTAKANLPVPKGGASRRLSNNTEVTDTSAPGQFAVSYPKPRGHESDPAHPIVREQVHAHREKMLADPMLHGNPDTLQGAWHADDGKVYLDASRLVPGRRRAVETGHADDQFAVRDMGRGRDISMAKPDKPGRRIVGSQTLGYTKRGGLGKGRPSDVSAGNRVAGQRRAL